MVVTFPTRGQSGSDDDRRREEAFELIDRLIGCEVEFDAKSLGFYESVCERRAQWGDEMLISPKQLFWLRDLAEKFT